MRNSRLSWATSPALAHKNLLPPSENERKKERREMGEEGRTEGAGEREGRKEGRRNYTDTNTNLKKNGDWPVSLSYYSF